MMKFFKWKIFAITSIVCLLPIAFGLIIWNELPDMMAIHFNVYGVADNYASKGFVVFGLPMLMVVLQFFCCFVNDINAHKHGTRKKLEKVTKWIVPCLTVLLQGITIGYALGWNLDIRKIVSAIVGIIFIVIGNYLPKFDGSEINEKNMEKAKKANRFIGFESVIMGILFIISVFLPPISSVICLILMIPYVITGIVYAILIGRRTERVEK